MSLQSLMIHLCWIKDRSATSGGAGGQVGSLSQRSGQYRCRVVPYSATRVANFQKAGMNVDYAVFFTANPSLTPRDQILFTDESAVTRTLVVQSLRNPDQMQRFWKAECTESTAVENR